MEIKSQLAKLPSQVINIPTRSSTATHEIVFFAENLPAIGFKQYYVKKQDKVKRDVDTSENEYMRKKYKNVFYANINDYWKNIKEQSNVEIKDLEGFDNKPFTEEVKIPDEPMKEIDRQPITEKQKYLEFGLDILKDNKDGELNEDIVELEKIIREARKSFDDDADNDDNKGYKEVDRMKYPALNIDEMRMLSDEPSVVEKYENDLENEVSFFTAPTTVQRIIS